MAKEFNGYTQSTAEKGQQSQKLVLR